MPQHLKIKLCRHPCTLTGRLGRGPILTFHSRILPYLDASGCGFLVACLGGRCPRSSLRVLGISSEPLLSPSPRIPVSPGCPGASLLWLGPPSITSQEAMRPYSCAVQPSPASAVCPPLPAASVHPSHLNAGLQTAPAAAAAVAAAAAAREGASQRAREGGGGSSLRSAHPLLSGRSALPLLPSPPLRSARLPHALPPPLQARPREPRVPGPRYPGNRLGDHSRRLPAPSHAHLLGVSPSQVPGPSRQRSPGFLAEAGGWVKRRGISEEAGPG